MASFNHHIGRTALEIEHVHPEVPGYATSRATLAILSSTARSILRERDTVESAGTTCVGPKDVQLAIDIGMLPPSLADEASVEMDDLTSAHLELCRFHLTNFNIEKTLAAAPSPFSAMAMKGGARTYRTASVEDGNISISPSP